MLKLCLHTKTHTHANNRRYKCMLCNEVRSSPLIIKYLLKIFYLSVSSVSFYCRNYPFLIKRCMRK